jgi:type I restriction-modification system DNA methylase subunit
MSLNNSKLEMLDLAIRAQYKARDLASGLNTAVAVLELLNCAPMTSTEDISLTKIQLPNSERYDHWFQPHPFFKSNRSCFELIDSEVIPLQAKFYWLQKKSKMAISGGVHFSPNWEDGEFTRTEGYKIGIDFFLSPNAESLLIVLSDRGNLRIVELSEWLRSTQVEIFTLWTQTTEGISADILHSTLWKSFQLQAVNEKFYIGVVNAFTELVQHFDVNVKSLGEVDSKQFVNRLIGRLLFCWFLKKRDVLDQEQRYFDTDNLSATDYYHARLEPLFFLTLNTPTESRAEALKQFILKSKSFLSKGKQALLKIDLKTPYLNGGLFEAHENDYFQLDFLKFPDGYFSRLFEHFDSYNFTTDESSPEYEQVAIDPEMLGKVFESLLASFIDETGSAERSARGTFYTPREIVSQMCRETLRDTLKAKFPGDMKMGESIDSLIDTSLSDWAIGGTNSKRDSIKDYGPKLIKALTSVSVIDPACGSGAFPIGMLNELIRLHQRLEPGVDHYELKISYLRDAIFGVDIEPMAIEICRLRAWLSILVDSPMDLEIEPLPNLDFKFVAADSLTKLPDGETKTLFGDNDLEEALAKIRTEYFDAKNSKQKLKLKSMYEDKIKETFEISSTTTRESLIRSFNPFESTHGATFFDPATFFGLDRFDIVIGNPPYVDSKTMTSKYPEARKYISKNYRAATGNWDLFVPFIERGLDLTADGGSLSYIVKNNLYGAKYAEEIRNLMMKNKIVELQEFRKVKVFEDAGVLPTIFRLSKSTEKIDVKVSIMDSMRHSGEIFIIDKDKFYSSQNWIPFLSDEKTRAILEKMNANKRLRNLEVIVGAGAAVDEAYKMREFVKEGKNPFNDCKKLINTGTLDPYVSKWGEIPTKYLKNVYDFPVVSDKELKKWSPTRFEQICKPKLIISGIRTLEAFFDESGEFIPGIPTTIIYFPFETDNHLLKMLTMLLNSKTVSFWFFKTFSSGGMGGGGGTISPKDLTLIPVPKLTIKQMKELEVTYDDYVQSPSSAKFDSIDKKISELYGLTSEEFDFLKSNQSI